MLRRIHITIALFLLIRISAFSQYTPADIIRVTVNPYDQMTTIYFTGTDHPDVSFYYVMQVVNEADGEFIPSSYTPHISDIDHVYEVTLDIPEVTQTSVGFFIRPHQDEDHPLTDFPSPYKDSTIHLSVDYDWCLNRAYLSWNDYNRWNSVNPTYRIFRDVNGIPEELLETTKGVNEFTVENLQAQNEYVFYVYARLSPLYTDMIVTSNGVSLDTLQTVYPEYIHADYGTVGEGNHPELQFSLGSESDVETFAILRSTNPTSPYDTLEYINSPDQVIRYTDTEADASQRPWYYKLALINSCDIAVSQSENIAGTIHLQGQLTGTTVNLNWTEYHNWGLGVADYQLERTFEGSDPEILTVSGLSHSDNPGNYNNQGYSSRVCYRVIARELPGDPHALDAATSISNEFCINLPMNLSFPFNAFTPEGLGNNTFGPYMEFLPSYYNFKIFNRNGTLVFHSEDPYNTPRWDGRLRNSSLAPEGVYRYILQYEDEFGQRSVLQGNVTLVRS